MKFIQVQEYRKAHDMLKIEYEPAGTLHVNPETVSLIEAGPEETNRNRKIYTIHLGNGLSFVTTADQVSSLTGVNVAD